MFYLLTVDRFFRKFKSRTREGTAVFVLKILIYNTQRGIMLYAFQNIRCSKQAYPF